MAALNNFTTPREGLSLIRPPYFDGNDFIQWKRSMMTHIQQTDYQLWVIINKGPFVPMKSVIEGGVTTRIAKTDDEFENEDFKLMSLNAKAVAILINSLSPSENRAVAACESAKEIWETLIKRHEGTTQVKKSKINQLNHAYEVFQAKPNESIIDLDNRFTDIVNSLSSLGRIISVEDQNYKILRCLPSSWEAKATAIEESKDLAVLSKDELIGSLLVYEQRIASRKDNGFTVAALKAQASSEDEFSESENDDDDMAMAVRNFKKYYRLQKQFENKHHRSKDNKWKNDVVCFNCNKMGHIAKECPNESDESEKSKRSSGSRHSSRDESKHSSKHDSKDKSKLKAMAAWDDSSDSDNDTKSGPSERANFCFMGISQPSIENESEVSVSPVDELLEQIEHLKETLKLKNETICEIKKQHSNEVVSLINTLSQLELKNQDLSLESESLKREVASFKQVILRLEEQNTELKKQPTPIKESKGKEVSGSESIKPPTNSKSPKDILEPRPIALEHATPAPSKAPTPPKNVASTHSHTSQHSHPRTHAFMYDRRGSRSPTRQNQPYQTHNAQPSFYTPAFHDPHIHQAPDYTFRQQVVDPYLVHVLFMQDQLFGMHQNTYWSNPRHCEQSTRSPRTKKTGHKPRVRKVWVRKDSLKTDSNPEGPKV